MRLSLGFTLVCVLTIWEVPADANTATTFAPEDIATCLSVNTMAPQHKSRRRNPELTHQYGMTCDGPIAYFANEWPLLVNYSFIFIDKTMLLKHVLNSPHHAILFAYPQRWGKTINLDMIRRFVELEVDERGGKVEPGNRTYYYNLFKYGDAGEEMEDIIFQKPLLISKHEDLFRKYHGHHPVIYMDLFCYGVSTMADYLETLYYRAFLMYKQHGYMLTVFQEVINSTDAAAEEKQLAQDIYNKFVKYTTVDKLGKEDLLPCVRFLSAVLYKHFNKKLFVFVDEYDDLVNYLFFEKDSPERDQILQLHYQFIDHSFRDNPYIEKVIFTGLTSLAKYTAGPVMSHVVEYNHTTAPFNRFYGYDQRELEAIYDHLNFSPINRTLIDRWCNQYKKSIVAPYKTYNPRFVNMYFDTNDFQTYVNYEPFRRTHDQVAPKIKSMPGYREGWTDILVSSGNIYTIEAEGGAAGDTTTTTTSTSTSTVKPV